MKNAALAITLLILTTVALGQVPTPAPAKPTLKDSVSLALRNLELKQTQRLLQMKQLEEQYNTLKTEYQTDGTKLSGLVASAVKDSGLDAEKYRVNADTLELTEIPKAPEAAKPEPKK